MDEFLAPEAGAPSSSAPARKAAVAAPTGSSAARKRLTAATRGKQPTAKKFKLSDLERLTGRQKSSGKKAGLSLALQKQLLSGLSSSNRRAFVLQRRNTEDNTPTPEGERASSAGQQRQSKTDKLRRKNRLAAAAAETAEKEGWLEIPSDSKEAPASAAPPSTAAMTSTVATSSTRPRAKVTRPTRKPVAARAAPPPRTGIAPPPQLLASAASTPAASTPVPAPDLGTAAAPPPPTLPPATASASHPLQLSTAARRPQAAVPKIRTRAGHIDEFFPRRAVNPSACPPPPPARTAAPVQRQSSLWTLGWAKQHARPPPARRYARPPARDYSDGGDSVNSEENGCENGCDSGCECRARWDPDADHLRWRGDSDDEEEVAEEEDEDEGRVQEAANGSAPRGLSSAGPGRRPSAEPATRTTSAAPAALVSGSAADTASSSSSASASAKPAARSKIAARAAAAAEKRAAVSTTGGTGQGQDPAAARTEEASPGSAVSGGIDGDAERGAAEQAAAVSSASATGTAATASDASAGGGQAAEETGAFFVDADGAHAAAEEEAPAAAWPCRRKRGCASGFLSQRQRTGGLRCRGVGVGDGGRDTFRRRALSTVFANGLRTQRLRLGRTSNSRVAAGVARGQPEGPGIHGWVAGGVTCMEFDSQGWYLAVAGENVTVYDFDKYLPKNLELKHTLVAGARAYLQPADGIQTKRTVSCVRWNPSDEEQLAVSYLHSDEVEVYDLIAERPGGTITPVQTLVPSSSSLNGNSGGRGHFSLEFVRRATLSTGTPTMVTHLVAGGRDGVFRVWRLAVGRVTRGTAGATRVAPYLQGQLKMSPRTMLSHAGSVAAVCCLNPDTVLVGTTSGLVAAYSLTPNPKPFRSAKDADKLEAWSLHDPATWGLDSCDYDAVPLDPAGFAIQFLRLGLDHGVGAVLCGLRSGRVVVFDTTCGRALGITEPLRGTVASVGFCLPPAAGAYVRPVATTAGGAPLTEGEGGTLPYGGGHWGPAVLACCKSMPEGEGREELVVLSTSARAALDSGKRRQDRGTTRPPRKSGMRPGPGWEVGEVGGGGFRVEESEGYDLCLPVDVVAATPGRSRVRLSKDVRGYVCPRDQGRLLRSRLVTSSVMIGREKHSVEAVNADGTELILDRKYRGPAVVDSTGPRDGEGVMAGLGGATFRRRAPSSNGGRSRGEDADGADDSSDADDPEPVGGANDADYGSRSRSSSPSPALVRTRPAALPRPGAVGAERAAAAVEGGAGSNRTCDRGWRPNEVRVFAKLRASFRDNEEQYQHEEAVFGGTRWAPGVGAEAPPPSPFALYEVVARAGLSLQETPVTAMTSHPRNNFVLVGLKDGTVAAVLPEGKRERSRVA
eukprot:g16485.t1